MHLILREGQLVDVSDEVFDRVLQCPRVRHLPSAFVHMIVITTNTFTYVDAWSIGNGPILCNRFISSEPLSLLTVSEEDQMWT